MKLYWNFLGGREVQNKKTFRGGSMDFFGVAQYAYSPQCPSYISHSTCWENLIKYQDILSIMTISFS